jgi:isoquinoline 1-oxidoreductase subunit beta
LSSGFARWRWRIDRPIARAMAGNGTSRLTRRNVLIGGGAGVGLIVAWGLWPRVQRPNLIANAGEHVFNGFVKIGIDGHVTIAVPQVEMGQGVYTTLPQILADELGADWRTIAVEAAPLNAIYNNALYARENSDARVLGRETPVMVTGGSTSVRGFEVQLRDAGAAARALLCMAASKRWDADWKACDTAEGFVIRGNDRMRFGEVAAEAAALDVPDDLTWRTDRDNRLSGQSLPRLDLPAKVDGTVNYAADIRLPDMVYAAIAMGPLGKTKLKSVDKAAANRITGVLSVVENDRWVAAIATNWWAANRAVEAMRPQFATEGQVPGNRHIDAGLDAAFDAGTRIASAGDVGAAFRGATVVKAEYRIGLAAHAAIEPIAATAQIENGRMQLWIGTQVPGLAAKAAAKAIGMSEDRVTVHPMMIGGSFGRRFEVDVAAQVAVLADRSKRPVQLVWSRAEDMRQDRFRPAAAARMTAKVTSGGKVEGWLAKIAVPATQAEMHARVWDGNDPQSALIATADTSDAAAVAGAVPPYGFANYAIDHHPAKIGVPTGDWRGRAYGLTAFFTECFIDELAQVSGVDPFSIRMAALGGNPRLARCLSRVTALGGWQGGAVGTGQGLACHVMADSVIAVLAEAEMGANGVVRVTKLFAVADCGRVINPNVVRQQIIGGLVFGMSAATGRPVEVMRGNAGPIRLGELGLPKLADMPEIQIELLPSAAAPGGVGELAVPPVAPAIANALYAGSGKRFRTLPLVRA